ncbi:MAG: c-type cytochrome [Planctomycetaceae bacterium]
MNRLTLILNGIFLASPVFLLPSSIRAADDFPEVYNSERDPAVPMSAVEAAATMVLPEGFSATVFAAEPDVRNPIAMAWDDRGRMWVAENYTYAERAQRFDLSLRDRVLIFHDKDGDGKADSRKVFADHLQMLTSVEVGHGGVWLMCPPQLLFIPDANGDDIPDGPAEVMLDGFEVGPDSHHNLANGLRWGPDGWLYGRCGHSCPGQIGTPGTSDDQRVPIDGGIWRYHPDRRIVEVLCHGTVNPWGHDWDRNGELFFINTVIGHLWHMMPGSHFKESFGESMNPGVYERMDMIADHFHFDTRRNWSDSRDGKANDLGGGHAHVGMLIYQSSAWPERYHEKLMTINMHGRRINVERLEPTSTGYVGRHEPDLMLSKDAFFRGTDLSVGPDGQVYVIDWSDIGECHESTGVHRESGRIFRISGGESKPSPVAKPACMSGEGKLPQLWKDYQRQQTTPERLRQLLTDPDAHVRVWAIRLLTDFWPLDRITGPNPQAVYPDDASTIQRLMDMAGTDPSGLVVRTLASTLQRLPVAERPELAAELLARREFQEEPDLALLTWYGLIPVGQTEPLALTELAAICRWPTVSRMMARNIASRIRTDQSALSQLLMNSEQASPACQTAVLQGIHEAVRGLRKAAEPAGWQQFCKLPGVRTEAALVRELSVVFGDGRAMEEVLRIVMDERADMQVRQSALETLIEARPENLRAVCEKLLDVRILNGSALKGLALFDNPRIAELLTKKYRRFQPEDRPAVIETLVSRPFSAAALLRGIETGSGQIPPEDISAGHARQILSLRDERLAELLSKVWGEIRESDADRQAAIADWKQRLTAESLQKANLNNGRAVFTRTCSACHLLFGEGRKVGPDLTGAQRSSLDYLLSNILDPSAVVGKDYRMAIVATTDGRVRNGLVVTRDDQKMVLQTATEPVTIPTEDIEDVTQSTLSAMPDGLLQLLTADQVRDLIAYLQSPVQVPLP